ncbi:GNAT family N-acetyltransferase [Glaciihabitans sp. dw_435]|uniref:GNAT family N-acetyltransferase n=1 Tax=Glaciihabitans sp. dw_435 TaxID=2720081 RepID=UPI001C4A6260|nr:GNAT family protein [Glaciihabitans sp. dw_435]
MLQVTSPIATERLLLRPMLARDRDGLFAYQSDPEVIRFLPWPLRTREESAAHLAMRMKLDRLEADDDAMVLGIELDGRLIGDITLFLRSIENAQAEIGWVLNPEFTGKGFAAEAAGAVLDLAFGSLGSHRVYAHLDPRNAGSVALCRRLGMREEAHHVESELFKGEWVDVGIYAILASERSALRARA